MNFVMSLIEQLRQFWNRTNLAGRIAVISGLALVLVTISAVGIWSSRPQYVPLATNLAPTETAEIVSALNAQGIPNQMNFAGSSVLVPKQQWNAARTAAGELINPAQSSDAVLDGSMFSDTTMNHYRLLKAKEDDLERSLLRLRAVQSADVHIAQPKRTPFARSQQTTSASVVLGIRPGAVFTQEQAATVVAHVASSVEGLTEENVTVSDLEGRTYTIQGRLGEAGILSRLDYRSRLEARLATKAETMLAHQLGPHKAIVRVSADIDFTEKKRTTTTYDATSKVKSTEKIETRTGVVSGGGGVVGTGGNGAGGGTRQTTSSVAVPGNSEIIDVTYLNGAVIEDTIQFGGIPTRLTIAALVDLGSDATVAGQAPTTAEVTKEQIEAIIKNAVGFDTSRNDQIEVVITTLAPPPDAIIHGVSETRKWEFVNQLARNSSLGLAALSALIITFITLRKMQPITISASGSNEDAERRDRSLADLSHQAHENPEMVSRILAALLNESSGTADNASGSRADTIPMRRAA